MAGNVKEWCWNEDKSEQHYMLGAAWDEAVHLFNDADACSPFERASNFGFRTVKYIASSDPGAAADPLPYPGRDYSQQAPCSDDLFRVYKSFDSYDRTPLNAKLESVHETAEHREERISLDAAYGNERMIAHLYLPPQFKPPLQAVVVFPSSNMFRERDPGGRGGRDFCEKRPRCHRPGVQGSLFAA